VAIKGGADRVLLVDETTPAETITAWTKEHPARELVVVDAIDHVVHTPLVTALKGTSSRIATNPAGEFAGAVKSDVAHREELVSALVAASPATRGEALATQAATWRAAGVETSVHGDIARHPARTPAERKAATHFLFGLVRKAQDTWLVRTINRKVSYPFTRLLLPTPITPNMISIAVFIIGVIGCIVLTQPGYWPPVYGTLLLLFAGYIDGCDGEIARIRLESSPLGAWIDTMADEATTVVFSICLGLHVYNSHGGNDDFLIAAIVAGALMASFAVYCVYYWLLSAGSSGNSQDYPTNGGLLDFLRLFVRREMINLGSTIMALAGQATVLYALFLVGGVVTSAVLGAQHIKLRRENRAKRASVAPSTT
jgi:phosphatidylglycerophosphate synthase